MSKGICYIIPTLMAKEFVSFTNDFTIWSAEHPAEINTTIGDTTRITIYVDNDVEEFDELDDYIGRSIRLMMPHSLAQKLLDETKTLLDLEKADCPDPTDFEIQTRKLQEAYTDYMQQPDELK